MAQLVKLTPDMKNDSNQTGKPRLVKLDGSPVVTPPIVSADGPLMTATKQREAAKSSIFADKTPSERITNNINQKVKMDTAQRDFTPSTEKSALERIGAGAASIITSTAATPFVLGEAAVETAKGLGGYLKEKWSPEVWQRVREDLTGADEKTEVRNVEIGDHLGKMDADSKGMQMMREANEYRQAATEGMTGAGKFLADTAIGIGQSAVVLPTAAINPALPLAIMGAQGAAQKAYDVTEQGGSAGEALARGAVAGTIEAITEKIPLDTLMDVVKTGGKGALRNIIKQAGIEAGEENISYLANLAADVGIAKDENAEFSWKDLGLSAAGGAISGGVFGGAGSAVNGVRTLPVRNAQASAPATAQNNANGKQAAVTLPVRTAQETALKTQKTAPTQGAVNENGLSAFTTQESENLSSGKRNKIVSSFQDAVGFIRNALANKQNTDRAYLGKVPDNVARKVLDETGVNVQGYNAVMPSDAIRHMFKGHSDPVAETAKGQVALTPDIAARIPQVLSAPDTVTLSEKVDKRGRQVLIFEKAIGDYYITAQAVSDGTHSLQTDTLFVKKMKNPQDTGYNADIAADPTHNARSVPSQGSSTNEMVTQPTPAVNNQTVAPEEASVGAAPASFVGDVERGFSKNLATDNARHEEIQNEYKVNPQMYHRLANAETLQKATSILNLGLDHARSTLDQAIGASRNAGKKFPPEMVPLSKMVADQLAAKGQIAEAERILSSVAVELTEAGQLGQAANILRDASPMTRRKSIQQMVDKLNEKYNGKADIKVDEALLDEYTKAQTEEAQAEALDKVYKNIASQVPATWQDKWNAWRYLAMLGNLRTHARNIAGNTFFQPVRIAKDTVAAAIEAVAGKASKGKMQRTKSFAAPALYKAAMADWVNVKDDLSQSSKYNEGIGAIESQKQVFKLPVLEKARKGNTTALEVEDAIFKRITYAGALSKYLKANGVTAQQLTGGTVDQSVLTKAREYASREALRATYQDKNDVSDLVSKIGKYQGDNKAAKFISTIVEGVLPFRRTPANILVRGLEYGPAGLAKGFTYDLYKVKKGEKTAAEAIDNIAAGLTGTGLLTAGAILAAMGYVSPGEDSDEKQATLDDLTGKQGYALNLPDGTSYTLDWLAPEALPFFMGAELADSVLENGFTADGLAEMLKSVSEPMLEMSMLQSLNDMIDSVSYADNKLGNIVTSALISYLNQGIPTIGGQIERTAETKRMTTYTDKNLPLPTDIQYAVGKAAARLPIPGVDYQQIPYIDAWGREETTGSVAERAAENFISPGYVSKDNTTAVDKEVQRLYTATGEGAVVPSRAAKSFTVGGASVNLSKEQYVKYATTKGKTAYGIIEKLISNDTYKKLSDADKVAAISDAYSFANAIAKAEVSSYKLTGWELKAKNSGIDPAIYILYRARVDTDGSGSVTQEEAKNAIATLPIPQSQKAKLWQSQNSSWKPKNNPFK